MLMMPMFKGVSGGSEGSWDITTAAYTGNSFYVGNEEATPTGITFSPDGLNMFMVGIISDTIYQYTLSSAFDITTATYTGNSLFIQTEDGTHAGLFFSPDGINLFTVGNVNDRVYQYTLSSAFDITTATYTGNSFYVGNEDDVPVSLFFSSDGFNMFFGGDVNDTIYQYALSSAFDITTTSYTGNSFYVGNEIAQAPRTEFFSPDGINLFVLDIGSDTIYQYTLSSAFDITTATYTGNSFYVGNEDDTSTDAFLSPDGLNMFMVGISSDTIYQYTLS